MTAPYHPITPAPAYPAEGNPTRAAAIIRAVAEACGQVLK